MHIVASSIVIAIIYLCVFIIIDQYYIYQRGQHLGMVGMDEQYRVQFISVFAVTFLLGLFEIDLILCSGEH